MEYFLECAMHLHSLVYIQRFITSSGNIACVGILTHLNCNPQSLNIFSLRVYKFFQHTPTNTTLT